MKFEILDLNPTFFEAKSDSQVWNNQISFQKGQLYEIYAPSGMGKSSFFRMLCGISSDYSGKIIFCDHDLKNARPKELSKFRSLNWSLVFQNLNLFEDISVKQNLEIFSDSNHYLELAERLDVQYLLDKKVKLLSYGERQRLAIIRSLSKQYDFLILDEPFSHLDSKLKEIALNMIIEDVKSKKAGMILLGLEKDDSVKFDLSLHL